MILVLKLVLTPLLIAAATLAGRRWGPGVSGWLVGLPLTSGPVSLILSLQNGTPFAAAAAVGVMGGVASLCVFCLIYALCAKKLGWAASALLSVASFFGAAFLCRLAELPLAPTFALVVVVITAVLFVMPRGASVDRPGASDDRPVPPAAWDLPARMVIAAAFVFGLTTAAAALGPRLSGLLSPFPVFGLILAAFAHRGQGPAAAARLLRGVVMGSYGFAVFFLVVALAVTRLPVAWTFVIAAAAALAVNGISLRAAR
jgi:hypothetical protein